MNTKFLIPLSLLLLMPNLGLAHFFIDYQDVTEPKLSATRANLDGFTLLTGKYHGLVQEIGTGIPNAISSFGEEVEIAEALAFILPEDWFAYVDEQIELLPQVSWDATEQPWLTVVADIGKAYGLRFLIDWDQKLLQIEPSHRQVIAKADQPTLVQDDATGRQVFIYTQETVPKGYIILNGEYVPVVMK